MQEGIIELEQSNIASQPSLNLSGIYQRLALLGQVRDYHKGELICQAGDNANYIYLLEEGRAKIFQIGNNGKELLLWFCCNGDVFGLNEALQNRKRTTYVQACAACRIITIPRSRFLAQLNLDPEIAMHVINTLSTRLNQVGQRMTRMIASDVQERVRLTLANLAEQYGVPDSQGVRIEMLITHQDLADMVGTSRQSVTSILNDFKRQGIIQIEKRYLWIREDLLACQSRFPLNPMLS